MSTINSEIKMQGNNDAWFTTNASVIFADNIQIFHNDGRYKFTDGSTTLSALPFLGSGSQNLSQVLANGNIMNNVQFIQSADGKYTLKVTNTGLTLMYDDGTRQHIIELTTTTAGLHSDDGAGHVGDIRTYEANAEIIHTTKIVLDAPLIEVSQDPTTILGISTKQYTDTKEPKITATTNVDFWSGAKTFINFATTVRATGLSGYVSGAGTITPANTILEAIQILNGNDALKLTIANNLSDLNSAKTARVNIGLDKRTAFGDANYSALITDREIVTSVAFTAPRTVTLIAGVNAGAEIIVADEFQTVTSTNTLTITVPTGKKLNGVVNGTEVIKLAGGWRRFMCDDSDNYIFDAGVVRTSNIKTVNSTTLLGSGDVITQFILTGGWYPQNVPASVTYYSSLNNLLQLSGASANRKMYLTGSKITDFYIELSCTSAPTTSQTSTINLIDLTTSTTYTLVTFASNIATGISVRFKASSLAITIDPTHDYTISFASGAYSGSFGGVSGFYYFKINS